MLSNKSVTTPALTLKPSRYLASYLIAIHALALMVLFLPLQISGPALFLIAVMILFSAFYSWHYKEQITALRAPAEDGQWRLQTRYGENKQAILCGEYFVANWLMVIRFRTRDTKKYSVVILPDSGAGDDIRRMRVYLKQFKQEE